MNIKRFCALIKALWTIIDEPAQNPDKYKTICGACGKEIITTDLYEMPVCWECGFDNAKCTKTKIE